MRLASFHAFELIFMMKENNSMLVYFQKLCKTLNETPWNFSVRTNHLIQMFSWSKIQRENILLPRIRKYGFFVLPRSSDISASSEPFPARIRVSGSPENPWSTVRAKSRRVNRSAARACKSEAATSISNESLLQAKGGATPWISRLILSPSSRGFVFPDRADALNRRPGSNLLRHAGLSGRIWIWASSAAGGAQRHLWISCHRLALFD